MALIYNSLENDWTIKKHLTKDVYIFTKNHGGKKQVYLDSYLRRFMEDNLNIIISFLVMIEKLFMIFFFFNNIIKPC